MSRNHWIGAVLLVCGVVSVVVLRRPPKTDELPPLVRPLKTMVVGGHTAAAPMEFPGKVAATEQVAMAFEFGGTLVALPVKEGDRVKKGQVLARLDPRDAQNQLAAADAELQRAAAQRDRMRLAAEAKAVSLQELSNAEASYNVAAAQRNIQKKLLDDTELPARFDGIIARIMVKNFEAVQAKQPILSLQDLSAVEISASIPEARIAHIRPRRDAQLAPPFDFEVEFDFLPGRLFKMEFKEFSTEAEALTQTFTAKFTLPSPDDVSILPGMACSVKITPHGEAVADGGAGFEGPLDAVPIAGVGQYYVWRVLEGADELYRTERRNVATGPLRGQSVLVTDGLAKGDRIALAGVHVLREGTIVRLLETPRSAAP